MSEETRDPGEGAAGESTRIYSIPQPAEAVGLVFRRWWVVLLVAALGSAAALFGAQRFRPSYQAYALIRLKPPSSAKVGASAEQEQAEEMPEPEELMRRLRIGMVHKPALVAMIQRFKADFDARDLANTERLVDWLTKYIYVEHRGGSGYKVFARARSPKLARKITAYLTNEALTIHRSGYEQAARRLETFSRQQVTQASAKLKALEDTMVDFLEKHPVMKIKSLHSDQVLSVEGADRLRAKSGPSVLARSLTKLAAKNPKLKQLLAQKKRLQRELKGLAATPAAGATTASAQALTEAKASLAELRGQGKKDTHPMVKQVLRRIKKLQDQIAATAPGRQTTGSAYEAKVRDELRKVEKAIRKVVATVGKTLPKQKKEDRAALEAQWARLRRDHTQLTEQYGRLQEAAVNATLKRNLRVYEAKKTAAIVEQPRAPEAPIGLSRPVIMAAGCVASLLFGALLALGLGILDTRLLRPEQVPRANARFKLLAVLANHPTRHLKQAQRVRHKELLGGEQVQGPGEAGAEGEDGSVIKWLRATDDLDTALDMLKDGQGPAAEQGQERWLDQVATEFYDRNAPRGLGQEEGAAPGEALVKAGGGGIAPVEAGPALPRLKVRSLPSAPPLAPGLFVSTDPRSKPAEQMRLLAARLDSQIGTALRVVAVSSWEAGIGKTTVAANLAMVLAESQKRVLVVDACPGGAALTRIFGIEPDGVGLCEQLQGWLDGGAEPWEVVQIAETLTVMPASSVQQPALPLLSSEAFSRLVNDMGQLFDALVIDTEALATSSDAVVLQRKVDGYVVVASRKRSTTRSLKEILVAPRHEQGAGRRVQRAGISRSSQPPRCRPEPGQGSARTSAASLPLTRRGRLRQSLRVKGRSVLLSGSVQSEAPSQHDTYPYVSQVG